MPRNSNATRKSSGTQKNSTARQRNGSVPVAIRNRLARCRKQMAKNKIPAYLLTGHMDTFYVSGFTGDESAVVVTPKQVHIVSDSRFDGHIDQEAPWASKHLRRNSLSEAIVDLCTDLKIDRLGVQSDGISVEMRDKVQSLAKGTRVVSAPPITRQLRQCKDEQEVKCIKKAVRIAQEAFKATCGTIRPGQTESEMAARLEYEMRKRGSTAPAFPTICAVGANAAHPHAHTGNRKAKLGSAVLFDWGATVGFYHSDLTRVVFIGRIPPRVGKVYELVLRAQQQATKAVKPGARMCDVDGVARKIITDAGFGEQFGHGLGHGLGLDVHEAPSLSWRSKEKLAPGMLVTVEPGVYLPGIGGVRIEDDVLVTQTGHRVLSNLPKDINSAVI